MTRRRSAVGPPRDYVRGEWPRGAAKSGAPSALEHARAVSVRLTEALEGRSVTEVAAAANVSRSTIYDVAQGKSWPDLVSLGQLSDALGVDLLPPLPQRDTAN